ncbi:hypothetical protein [Zavarzinella formosa]|uniref:hypothetical protein n=1 Tax=Zavarzinella formosa TaxID=360055 RepID=UPI0003139F10|nr:hypothetical protein [Zavarzinella formosa]
MSVQESKMATAEVVRRGHEIYDRVVKPVVRPEDHGKFVAIEVLSEDFELDADDYSAAERLRVRRPSGEYYLGRVGYPTAYQSRGFR